MTTITPDQIAEIAARSLKVQHIRAAGVLDPTEADMRSAQDVPALLAHVRAVEAERDAAIARAEKLQAFVRQVAVNLDDSIDILGTKAMILLKEIQQ